MALSGACSLEGDCSQTINPKLIPAELLSQVTQPIMNGIFINYDLWIGRGLLLAAFTMHFPALKPAI